MVWQRKDEQAAEMYALYQKGHSFAQVGKAFGVSRQAVHELLTARGLEFRRRPTPLPFLTFNGFRYTIRNNGYYGKTKGGRTMMHRDVWEFHHGKIPPKYDIHHVDQDRTNNEINNLELISKKRHGAHHSHLFHAK